jgi:ABC-type lipoprotein export system ATPase subunit
MVFQGPSLLRELTVAENVALPLVLAGSTASDGRRRARDVLERLELRDLADALPEEVSGGQAQRVSVARALVGDPQLILADEPTGQLDRATATTVVDVLLQAALANGAALLVATHDPVVAERLDERWEVHAGRLETGGTVWPR